MLEQPKIINKINSFTIDSLPHSILLLGDRGSGQEELCEYIANKFNLTLFNLTETITNDFISEINGFNSPYLYIVNMLKITEREQNILLKLYEEPSNFTYLILYGENDQSILETIKNRSYTLLMDKFTPKQLEKYITSNEKELILNICTTPGQVEIANHTNMKSLYDLCNTMIDKLKVSNFSNALSISSKINFKDEYDKYDLYLFIKVLSDVLTKRMAQNTTRELLEMYFCLDDVNHRIWPLLNKKQQFENCIIKLWELSRVYKKSEEMV